MLLFYQLYANAKVLIMTYVYNRPDFIELHVKTFNKFLKDEYEYVVFNDAPTHSMRTIIEHTCNKIGVRCLRVPDHRPQRQTPSYRHMDGIRFSFEQLGFAHNDILVMIDADMFLVRPFSIREYLKNSDLLSIKQTRMAGNKVLTYIAPSLVFINMKTVPNKRSISFEADRVEGVSTDVGGQMYYYFKNNPDIRLQLINAETVATLPLDADQLAALGYDHNTIDLILTMRCFEYYLDGTFIHHYAGGSNWAGYSGDILAKKKKAIFEYVEKQISFYKKEIGAL